jgi:hypothetical protein
MRVLLLALLARRMGQVTEKSGKVANRMLLETLAESGHNPRWASGVFHHRRTHANLGSSCSLGGMP